MATHLPCLNLGSMTDSQSSNVEAARKVTGH